jgi:hypothetical protein
MILFYYKLFIANSSDFNKIIIEIKEKFNQDITPNYKDIYNEFNQNINEIKVSLEQNETQFIYMLMFIHFGISVEFILNNDLLKMADSIKSKNRVFNVLKSELLLFDKCQKNIIKSLLFIETEVRRQLNSILA